MNFLVILKYRRVVLLLTSAILFGQRLFAQIEIFIVPNMEKSDTFPTMQPAAKHWFRLNKTSDDKEDYYEYLNCKREGSSVMVIYRRIWVNRAGPGGADKPEKVIDDPQEETSGVRVETVESWSMQVEKPAVLALATDATKPKRPVVKEAADINPSGNTGTRSFRYVKHKSGLTSIVETGVNERVVEVKADLSVAHLGKGSDVTDAGRLFVTTLGRNSDDAGHVIANRLGGGGGDTVDNLFPQLANLNRGAFAQWEAQIAECVTNTKNKVAIDIKFNYGQGNSRPISIDYNVTVNGIIHFKHFNN
jgi:hypothetical protein